MPWLAIKLFFGGMLKRLLNALGALLKWAKDNPAQAIIIALCCLLAGGYWHYSGKVADLQGQVASKQKTIDDMKAASAENLKAQLAQKARVEQHYKDIAHEADKEHAEQLADANDALARYIASHRVRGPASSNSSGPGPAAQGGNPGLPESLPSSGFVAVSDDDMQRCTAATIYAIDAHNWAIKLAEQQP